MEAVTGSCHEIPLSVNPGYSEDLDVPPKDFWRKDVQVKYNVREALVQIAKSDPHPPSLQTGMILSYKCFGHSLLG